MGFREFPRKFFYNYFYWVFPGFVAFIAGLKIRKDIDILLKQDRAPVLIDELKSLNSDPRIEERVFSAFEANQERRKLLESKATALLTAGGLIIAISSFLIKIFEPELGLCGLQRHFVLYVLIGALINLLFTMVLSIFAIKITHIFLEPIPFYPQSGVSAKLTHFAKLREITDLNNLIMVIKNNFTESSQMHFLYGLFYLTLGIIISLIFFV